MHVLLIDSGGREHALCLENHQSEARHKSDGSRPANAGLAEIANIVDVKRRNTTGFFALVATLDGYDSSSLDRNNL